MTRVVTGTSEQQITARFAERYRVHDEGVSSEIERAVIGGDWGANGYTTVAQADHLARATELGAGDRLLDIGAGRGWPGLYLAAQTGCEAVLSDVPIEGLGVAMGRATREELSARAVATVASARSLPFASQSFDAIVHTDVLCCVRPKTTVLRDSLRCLRPGGHTAFLTIHASPGLGRRDRRRAASDGPPAVLAPRSTAAMLRAAGFVDVEELDVTEEFARVARHWIEASDARFERLAEVVGADVLANRQLDRRIQLQAVEDGLLRRSLLTAVRPAAGRRPTHA